MDTTPDTTRTLAHQVGEQLVYNEETKDSMIDVLDHNGGVLTLQGTAPSHAARLAAEMLAYATPGVNSVIVDIGVPHSTDVHDTAYGTSLEHSMANVA